MISLSFCLILIQIFHSLISSWSNTDACKTFFKQNAGNGFVHSKEVHIFFSNSRCVEVSLWWSLWNPLVTHVCIANWWNVYLQVKTIYLNKTKLPLKLRFKSASILQLYQMTLSTGESLYKNDRDFVSLSANDRSILLNGSLMHTTKSVSSNFIFL